MRSVYQAEEICPNMGFITLYVVILMKSARGYHKAPKVKDKVKSNAEWNEVMGDGRGWSDRLLASIFT